MYVYNNDSQTGRRKILPCNKDKKMDQKCYSSFLVLTHIGFANDFKNLHLW